MNERSPQARGVVRHRSWLYAPPFIDAIICEVDGKNRAVLSDGNRGQMTALAGADARVSESSQEHTARGKFLDSMIVKVGGKYVALRTECNTLHSREPPIERTVYVDGKRAAPISEEVPLGIEYLYAVAVTVRHE